MKWFDWVRIKVNSLHISVAGDSKDNLDGNLVCSMLYYYTLGINLTIFNIGEITIYKFITHLNRTNRNEDTRDYIEVTYSCEEVTPKIDCARMTNYHTSLQQMTYKVLTYTISSIT